jgi:emfourin
MKVNVTRRGGLVGIPMRGEVDTAALGRKRARADAALAALPADQPVAPPSHPDGFQFELAFNGRNVTIDETDVSEGLRPVIDGAMAHATLG